VPVVGTQVLTVLIDHARGGDAAASARLLELVYDDLRQIAAGLLYDERPGQTLQPTALVNEAFLKIAPDHGAIAVENRRHLFGVFANAMRQVLVDAARRRSTQKRGGDRLRESQDMLDAAAAEPIEFVRLGDELDRFEREDARAAEVVRLKVFAGLQVEAIAELMGVPKRTVERDWTYAKSWLSRELAMQDSRSASPADRPGPN
jgi:RNA polymerase sigma factor (TIGR02999 family)